MHAQSFAHKFGFLLGVVLHLYLQVKLPIEINLRINSRIVLPLWLEDTFKVMDLAFSPGILQYALWEREGEYQNCI